MSFEELNVPKNHIYLFKPQKSYIQQKGMFFGPQYGCFVV